MKDYDFIFKLLLVGSSGVGKSSLLMRYADDEYTDTYVSTIGVDFKIKTITMDGKVIKLQIWDTAGQERFRTITSTYYRGAQGIMLVYDVTDSTSFNNIRTWIKEIDKYSEADVPKILIGNKIDLEHKRVVDTKSGQTLAKDLGLQFIETSAKRSKNIDICFEQMVKTIKDNLVSLDDKPKTYNFSGKSLRRKRSCCL